MTGIDDKSRDAQPGRLYICGINMGVNEFLFKFKRVEFCNTSVPDFDIFEKSIAERA